MSSQAISIGATLLSLKAIIDLLMKGQLSPKSAFTVPYERRYRQVFDIRSNNSLAHDRVLNWHQRYSSQLADLSGIQIGTTHSDKVLQSVSAEVDPEIKWFRTGPVIPHVVSDRLVEGFVIPAGAVIHQSDTTGFKSSVIVQIRLASSEFVWIMTHPIPGLFGVELADLLCRMVSADKSPIWSGALALPVVDLETDASVDWLRGIEVGGNPIPQVTQRVHLNMVPKALLACANQKFDPCGVFEVNKPFYLAVSRTETSFPYVGGFIDLDSMRPLSSS